MLQGEVNGTFWWSSEDQMQREKRLVEACWIHEASEGSADSIGNQDWSHSCDILTKNLVPFSLCPENLSKFEFKAKRLICVKEDNRAGQKGNMTKPTTPKSRAVGKHCRQYLHICNMTAWDRTWDRAQKHWA